MNKTFEDCFSELQADMVSICLEYIEGNGDKIYIYCSKEKTVSSTGFFFKIDGELKERHKVNEIIKNLNVSPEQQQAVLNILMDDLHKIDDLCKKYEKPMPTEMKLIYDIKSQNFNAEYKYDYIHTIDEHKTASDIEDEWFNAIKNQD